jgi:hypothetical protein
MRTLVLPSPLRDFFAWWNQAGTPRAILLFQRGLAGIAIVQYALLGRTAWRYLGPEALGTYHQPSESLLSTLNPLWGTQADWWLLIGLGAALVCALQLIRKQAHPLWFLFLLTVSLCITNRLPTLGLVSDGLFHTLLLIAACSPSMRTLHTNVSGWSLRALELQLSGSILIGAAQKVTDKGWLDGSAFVEQVRAQFTSISITWLEQNYSLVGLLGIALLIGSFACGFLLWIAPARTTVLWTLLIANLILTASTAGAFLGPLVFLIALTLKHDLTRSVKPVVSEA